MMLNVLPSVQQKLWHLLASLPIMPKFHLAGGTAVALHFQHRESIDFDFFTFQYPNLPGLVDKLRAIGPLEVTALSESSLLGFINGVKISFFHYPYAPIEPLLSVENIQVASLQDLAAMKLVAVAQRGTKKDFIDVHEYLMGGWNLYAFFDAAQKKFKDVSYNKVHYAKSLSYFADAEEDPMPKMLKPRKWEEVKKRLQHEALELIRNL